MLGSTNPTNWNKPKQRQRNSSIITQEYNKHTTNEERTQGTTLCALSFAHIIRKGKSNNNPQGKERHCKRTKKDNQSKERQAENKRTKAGQRRRKKDKRKANTQKVFNPPNSTRAQKPHKPRKSPRQHKPTQQPQTTLKTPLKREIEPYLQATHQGKSERADKRREHTTRGPQPRSVRSCTLESPALLHRVGTTTATK